MIEAATHWEFEDFANEPWWQYASGAMFVRRCEYCLRFVTPDKTILTGEEAGLHPRTNATCKAHGRVHMLFAGFV